MKRIPLSLVSLLLVSSAYASPTKAEYIQSLERANHIHYQRIDNERAAYITSMCYTQVEDNQTHRTFNPCYSCHTKGKTPNYTNDSDLQLEYNFPMEILKNPYTNLFKDRRAAVAEISDAAILKYVRGSNYFKDDGSIALASMLPKDWRGYRPDCYYHFDAQGFDYDPQGALTGWRAFRYYPFLGTFWPTNGSTDDVLIRLPKLFGTTMDGHFDTETYALNLSIVEAVVKQKTIPLSHAIDEAQYGVDLNQNGQLDRAKRIVFSDKNFFRNMSYVGQAKAALQRGQIHLAGGLYPEGTEFLHSVRYLDWDDHAGSVTMAARMKELRYARKTEWQTYSDLDRGAKSELWESEVNQQSQTQAEIWQGNYEEGLQTGTGWVYQGFIEDKQGVLRPQTHEETINCMGCHAGVGATTDSTYAFPRKLEGTDPHGVEYGWNHWSQKGLKGVHEPKASYLGHPHVYEYSFYLRQNHSGNEFRDNDEVQRTFFDANGTLKTGMISRLHDDISLLLLPSKKRALGLDKGYKVMVGEQSFIYGRDANVAPMSHVFKTIKRGQPTHIRTPIVQE